jgi:hypothetical protein
MLFKFVSIMYQAAVVPAVVPAGAVFKNAHALKTIPSWS